MTIAMLRLAVVSLITALALSPAADSKHAPAAPSDAQDPKLQKLVDALAEQNVHIDPAAGAMWIPVHVEVRDELLEYLLVGPAGATHETLFKTSVPGSVLNTALLSLGMQPGRNAHWRAKNPRPSEEEMRAGVAPYEVTLPQGDALELYVAWRQDEELYFYRVEDLLRNLLTSASMRRHRWVYLGSKMLPPDPRKKDAQETFAADVYQNLINITYFSEAYTLLTAALPECVEQTIWLPNAWLLPQRGTEIALFFSRASLSSVPPSLAEKLPRVDPADRDARKLVRPGEDKSAGAGNGR